MCDRYIRLKELLLLHRKVGQHTTPCISRAIAVRRVGSVTRLTNLKERPRSAAPEVAGES